NLPPHSERTDAKLHVRSLLLYPRRQFANKIIYILPTPVVYVFETLATELSIRATIGKRHVRNAIWIEIVIEVYSIHVVMPDCLHDRLKNEFTCFRMTRIVVIATSILEEPLRMLTNRMIRCIVEVRVHACPIRIKPRMKFKSTFPRLFYHEHQRIVVWLHRSTLRSGEILSPWLVRRWIKCIRDRTNLHDDG